MERSLAKRAGKLSSIVRLLESVDLRGLASGGGVGAVESALACAAAGGSAEETARRAEGWGRRKRREVDRRRQASERREKQERERKLAKEKLEMARREAADRREARLLTFAEKTKTAREERSVLAKSRRELQAARERFSSSSSSSCSGGRVVVAAGCDFGDPSLRRARDMCEQAVRIASNLEGHNIKLPRPEKDEIANNSPPAGTTSFEYSSSRPSFCFFDPSRSTVLERQERRRRRRRRSVE